MNADEVEFLISQYVDGTLDAAQSAALLKRLETDASARALLSEHRRTQEVLRRHASMPVALDWDRLADRISEHIDESVAAERRRALRIPVGAWLSRAAAVAAVLVVAALARQAWRAPVEPGSADSATVARVLEVSIPPLADQPAPAGPRVIEVAIAPPPASIDAEEPWLAMEVLRPDVSRLLVAGGGAATSRGGDPFDGY